MRLIDITKDNWEDVISLTTREDGSIFKLTLIEEFVASNAYTILQSIFEDGWVVKAIEAEGVLVGMALYGFSEPYQVHELCRIMIDRRHQGKGYGQRALQLILDAMREQFGCREIYLSVDPENERAKRVYEKHGFVKTGEIWNGEEVYVQR